MTDSSNSNSTFHLPNLAGDLPIGWTWRRLDTSCLDVVDCPHSTPEIAPFGPLMVRSQDIRTGVFLSHQAVSVSEETYQDRIRRAEPIFGDLVYSREGTYFGIAAEVPRNTRVCLGQRMVLLRPDSKSINSRFLKYWLNSPLLQSHINGHRDGTVAERLNLPTIRALPIPVAPLGIQNRIAYILGTLDDKIELNRRTNETLETMARRLFRSWFIDFDPVHAKAALRRQHPKFSNADLSRQALTNMDSTIAELFPDGFEDSTLGPIPKGWNVGTVPDAIEINPTRSLSKGSVAPWLEMSNMPTRSARALAWEHRQFGSGTKFINGDTLVARITPCLENGKTGFVDFLNDGQVGAGSTEYIVLRPKTPLPPIFAYLLARTDNFRQHLITNMTGTSGRQRAPADCLHKFPLVTPPAEIAHCFSEATENLFAQMKLNDEESATLTVARDRLIPRLLSGNIQLHD